MIRCSMNKYQSRKCLYYYVVECSLWVCGCLIWRREHHLLYVLNTVCRDLRLIFCLWPRETQEHYETHREEEEECTLIIQRCKGRTHCNNAGDNENKITDAHATDTLSLRQSLHFACMGRIHCSLPLPGARAQQQQTSQRDRVTPQECSGRMTVAQHDTICVRDYSIVWSRYITDTHDCHTSMTWRLTVRPVIRSIIRTRPVQTSSKWTITPSHPMCCEPVAQASSRCIGLLAWWWCTTCRVQSV